MNATELSTAEILIHGLRKNETDPARSAILRCAASALARLDAAREEYNNRLEILQRDLRDAKSSLMEGGRSCFLVGALRAMEEKDAEYKAAKADLERNELLLASIGILIRREEDLADEVVDAINKDLPGGP